MSPFRPSSVYHQRKDHRYSIFGDETHFPVKHIGPTHNIREHRFLTISDTSLRKNAKQGSTSHANSSRTRRHSRSVNVNFVGMLLGEGSASTSSPPPPTPSTVGFGACPAVALSVSSFAWCLRRKKHSNASQTWQSEV